MTYRGWRIAGWLLLGVVLLGAAGWIEQAASTRAQGNLLALDPALLSGAYAPEQSDTLPGPAGPLRRVFRWTEQQSALAIWPSLPGAGRIELETLNPATDGAVFVQMERAAVALPPTPTLRRVALLLPPGTTRLDFVQTGAVPAADRSLGMILSEARWTAFGANDLHVFAQGWRLPGLPLTLLLVIALGVLLRLRPQWIAVISLLALGLALMGVLRRPWDLRAVQPALQIVLVGGCLGALCVQRRFVWRRWPALLIGVWALTTLLLFTPRIAVDGAGYYAYLRSALIDGDLQFANELDPAQSPLHGTPPLARQRTPTGYTPNPWSVGPAIAWTPGWLLAHGLVLLGTPLGLGWQPDGYAAPYIVLTTFTSALAGLATLLGCFAIARRLYAPPIAALTAITLYLGSNLLFYAQFEGGFAHSLSAATATWFVEAVLALHAAPSLGRWLRVGWLAGAMIVVYWITAILLLFPIALVLPKFVQAARHKRTVFVQWVIGSSIAALGALLMVLPQLLAWRLIYGTWIATPQGANFITPRTLHLGSILWGSIYGLVWWTPAYFIGLIGCFWLTRRWPWLGVAILLPTIAYILYNAGLPDWHGSGAFGMRRFTALTPFFAVGLAAIFNAARRIPALPGALAGAIVLWTAQMMARYLVFQISHDPLVLMDLGLRDVLYTSWRAALGAGSSVVRNAWIPQFVQYPSVGAALITLVCLIFAALLWLGVRIARVVIERAAAAHKHASHARATTINQK